MIRYRFLWSSEQVQGAMEGAKDRPCAIVVAARRDPSGDIQTIVAPITYGPPEDPAASIEIPQRRVAASAWTAVGIGFVSTN
ncbi:MAG: hypothetical protein L6R19_05530 [Alphaproteobacteria bacterium]|nr:hypothetical protein [Alphaproteobacteria bacterium]